MSSNSINISVVDDTKLKNAELMLKGVKDGVPRALNAAVKRAAQTVRSASSSEIRQRYDITNQALRTDSNVTINYTYGNGIEASIRWLGNKIPLYRFNKSKPERDIRYGRWVPVMVEGQWRMVHPSNPSQGHQLKGTSVTKFPNAVTLQMKSGHVGIFERTGAVTASGSDEIHELMGSSVAQMVGSEEVKAGLTVKALEKFDERFEHEVLRLMNGW